jgi:hypothetical protein
MIDPYDVRSIARAIKALDDDDSAVAELGQRGLVQAERFSAGAYRQRLGEFYARLTGTASPLPYDARAAQPVPITKAQSA